MLWPRLVASLRNGRLAAFLPEALQLLWMTRVPRLTLPLMYTVRIGSDLLIAVARVRHNLPKLTSPTISLQPLRQNLPRRCVLMAVTCQLLPLPLQELSAAALLPVDGQQAAQVHLRR